MRRILFALLIILSSNLFAQETFRERTERLKEKFLEKCAEIDIDNQKYNIVLNVVNEYVLRCTPEYRLVTLLNAGVWKAPIPDSWYEHLTKTPTIQGLIEYLNMKIKYPTKKKKLLGLNSDEIYDIVLKRIEEYEDFTKRVNTIFNYQDFKDYNNNCR